jgi:hypothetical protein
MSQSKIESLKARVAKLNEQIAKLEAAAVNDITTDKLVPDQTVVTFVSGKDKTPATGTVLAVVVNEKGGTVVRVFVSAGADSRIASPFMSQITAIVSGGKEPEKAVPLAGDDGQPAAASKAA